MEIQTPNDGDAADDRPALTDNASPPRRAVSSPRTKLFALLGLLIVALIGVGAYALHRHDPKPVSATLCAGTPTTAGNCGGTYTPTTSPTLQAVSSPTSLTSFTPAEPGVSLHVRYLHILKPGFPDGPGRSLPPITTPSPAISPTGSATLPVTPTSSQTPILTPTTALTGTITATAALTVTDTPTAVQTGTITPTAALTGTVTPSAALTGTITPSTALTGTATPTVTPVAIKTAGSQRSPTPAKTGSQVGSSTPSKTETPSITVTPASTMTPTISPTPAEIGLLYNYSVSGETMTLTWRTSYSSSFAIDGVTAPLTGQRTVPLQTHTYVLAATSLDRTQARLQVVAMVLSQCNVRINGQQVNLQRPSCVNGVPLPTATPSPAPATTTPTPSLTRSAAVASPHPGVGSTPAQGQSAGARQTATVTPVALASMTVTPGNPSRKATVTPAR